MLVLIWREGGGFLFRGGMNREAGCTVWTSLGDEVHVFIVCILTAGTSAALHMSMVLVRVSFLVEMSFFLA